MSASLSIVVPVFNEARTLPALLEALQQHCAFAQMIFVNDGSRDGSMEILQRHARKQDIILTKPNGGKGSAVRMGYGQATGTYTIIQDADLEYDPAEIPGLLAFAEKGNLPAVFGSRRLHGRSKTAHPAYYWGGVTLTWMCNALFGLRLTDQATCYKMVRTDILRTLDLRENDFRFDAELTAALAEARVPIVERHISYRPRTVHEGKKIGWNDWWKTALFFLHRAARKRSLVSSIHAKD